MNVDDMDAVSSFDIRDHIKSWSNREKAEFAFQILSTLPPSEASPVVRRLSAALSQQNSLLSQLPYEVLLLILSFLDLHTLLQASLVNTEWHMLCKEQSIWKNLYEERGWTYNSDEMEKYLKRQHHQPYIADPEDTAEEDTTMTEKSNHDSSDNGNIVSSIPIKRSSSPNLMGQLSSRFKQVRISTGTPSSFAVHENRLSASPPYHRSRAASPLTVNHLTSRFHRTRISPNSPPSNSYPIIQATTETVDNIRRVKTYQLIKRRRDEEQRSRVHHTMDDELDPSITEMEMGESTRPFIDWQELYKNRNTIEQRWLGGSCKIEYFPGYDCPASDLHTEGIYCVQFDKEKMITGSRDHTIKIWDLATGRCRQTLRGHNGSVLCLQYDTHHIVSGSSDATILISDIITGTVERKLVGHEDSVLSLRIVGNDRVISCSKDRSLRLWRTSTGECIRVFNDHRAAVNSVQWKDDIAVSASGDRTVKIWNMATGECLRTLSSHTRGVACVEYDGIHIVSGSSDQTIKVWNAETGECLYTLCGHTELVRTIQLDTVNNRIISGCYNGQIKLWDLKEGKLLRNLGQATDGRVLNTKFDCTKIVCTSNLNRVIIYDFAHGLDTTFLL